MRTISLWQPWATLIAIGAKHYETRSWNIHFRGEIAIHAARTGSQLPIAKMQPFRDVLAAAGFPAQLIRAWLAVRPAQASTLFCGLSNQRAATPLSMSGLQMILKRLKAKAGVTGRVNPHSFRHGFAREYLINGGDLATLAQIMGHSDVRVTASFYAIFTHRELQERHQQFSPIAKWEAGGG